MITEKTNTGWCGCGHKFTDHTDDHKPCNFDGCDCQSFRRDAPPEFEQYVQEDKPCICPRIKNGKVLAYDPACEHHVSRARN
jgi:hypothetical protein